MVEEEVEKKEMGLELLFEVSWFDRSTVKIFDCKKGSEFGLMNFWVEWRIEWREELAWQMEWRHESDFAHSPLIMYSFVIGGRVRKEQSVGRVTKAETSATATAYTSSFFLFLSLSPGFNSSLFLTHI